jgi:type IV pilus assembly protein PilA
MGAYQTGAQAAGMPMNTSGGDRKKLIIIILAIAAAIAVVLLILFLFVFKSKKDLIIGTWAADEKNGSYMRFNKDGTAELDVGSNKSKAVYKIDGDTIIITRDSVSMNFKIDKLTEDKLELTVMAGLHTTRTSFTKVNDDDAVKSYTEKSKLKTANTNAKVVFTTLNNEAADRIADGERVEAVHTNGAVAVADLEDSSDPLLKAVYKALSDNGKELGYVYIEFDPNNYESTGFVQWSASESGGLIGQYPNPVKTVEESEGVTFGQKN